MAAPKGNNFWEARSTHGRKPIFERPEFLWVAACEYFHWAANNPLVEEKVSHFQGKQVTMKVDKMRAMTIKGLCIFLDISYTGWLEYGKREKYVETVARIVDIIYDQKFSGAAAGMLNPVIIARDLGLKDTQAHEHSGPDGAPLQVTRTIVDPLPSDDDKS